MHIVLDTNVLAIAATPTSGAARELLRRCVKSPHVIAISECLLSEVSRMLRYARMRKPYAVSDRRDLPWFVTMIAHSNSG